MLDHNNMPAGLASGCLMDYHGRLLLLTVLHATEPGLPLALEIEWVPEARRMKMWGFGGLNFLGRVQIDTATGEVNENATKLIDYGYVDLPNEIQPRLQKIDFHSGAVTESRDCTIWPARAIGDPVAGARYGFAGHTKPSLEDHSLLVPDVKFWCTELRVCFPMDYVGPYDDFHVFRLPVEHPGDEYFRGCSGAPIIDEDGHVVALVCGGDRDRSLIYGVSLRRYQVALDIHTGRFA